jgi:hypothetical protein
VGIKEVHDDIWLVSFMHYDLGYFDLETWVLEPLEQSLKLASLASRFLSVLSVQCDGEKPDKITRGACACNDDRVIFENPLIYPAAVFRVPGMN